jgi:hypothetical protein
MKELASRGNVEDNALIQYTIDGITDDTSNKIILYGANNLKEFKRKLQIFESLRENSMKMFKTKKEPEIREEVMKKQDMKYKKEEGKQIRCFNCGLKGHRSIDCRFKEKGTKCFKCNNYGHRAKECNEDNKQKKQSEIEKKSSPTVYLSNSLQDEEPPENHEICHREVTDRVNSRNFKNLKLCGTDFEALIDTGSDVNLIKARAFLKIGAPRFEETPLTLTGLGNGKVKTLGKFSTKINIDNCEFVTEIHIVSDEAISINLIIGRPILNKVTLIMNSEGVMVTEDVTEMKETNLLNNEKKVQERIAAEDENTTIEDDELSILQINLEEIPDVGENIYLQQVSELIENYKPKYTQNTKISTKIILEDMKQVFGNPRTIITDRGSAFTCTDFQQYCTDENIKHINVTTGVPRGNGQVERINRIIIPVLTKLSFEKPEAWYRQVRPLQEALNSTHQRSINTSPFELLFGVKMLRSEDIRLQEVIEEEYAKLFIEERDELRKEAKQQIKKIQEENIKNYNRKRKMAREYKPRDQVAIKRTQFKTTAKILPKYLGPYEVIKKIGNDRYDVEKIGTHDGPRTTKSCAEMMKPWCQEDLDSFEANEFQDGRVVGNG